MKKSKQIAVFSLCAAVLCGCGNSQPADSSTDTETGKKEQVTFWYSGGKTAANVMEEIIAAFNDSQDQYQVTGITQGDYDETYQKLQAGIASSTAADLALLDADKSHNLAVKGLLEDFSQFTGTDSDYQTENYLDVFFRQGVLEDGTVFALPAYGTTQVLYYNRDVFHTAHILPEEITTWQDMEQAAKKLSDCGLTDVYAWEPMWNADNLIDAAFSNGAAFFTDDGKTVTINSPEWVEVWESFRRWIHEDNIMKIHYGGQGWEYWYETMDDAVTGKSAGYTGSSGDQADLDFKVVGAMEQPGFGTNPSAPAARALQLVLPKNKSDNKKQGAYAFIKYFNSPENQAKWSMATGYVPVCEDTLEDSTYKEYTVQNPQALVPFQQAMHGSILPVDPTGGKIYDALDIAADKVEIENISAQDALDEAQATAQRALDDAL